MSPQVLVDSWLKNFDYMREWNDFQAYKFGFGVCWRVVRLIFLVENLLILIDYQVSSRGTMIAWNFVDYLHFIILFWYEATILF